MFRTALVAVLGIIATMLAAEFSGPAWRLYSVGLVVAVFGVWTVNELSRHYRVNGIILLLVLIAYGALAGIVAGWVIG